MYESFIKPYKMFIAFPWLETESKKIPVTDFEYTLTQYTPSVYAKVTCLVPADLMKKFDDIKTKKVQERTCRIDAIGAGGGGLTRVDDNYSMFSGPWYFTVLKYDIKPCKITPYEGEVPINATNDNGNGMGMHYYITLECIDRVWFSMSVGERNFIYKDSTISDVVKTITKRHDGIPKIVDTVEKYDWKQYDKTDYYMIRNLIAFARSEKKEFAYTFYCFNNEVIFQPMARSEEYPVKIYGHSISNMDMNKDTQNNEDLIEMMGGKDDLNIKDSSFKGFRATIPNPIDKQSNKGKVYDGDSIRSLHISIEEPVFKEIFISSFRKRILSLKKVISINTFLDTNITPMNVIEIIDQTNDQIGLLDGKFYVLSVTHHIPQSTEYPFIPYTQLIISTDAEDKGLKEEEASPIVNNYTTATYNYAGKVLGLAGLAGSNILDIINKLLKNEIKKINIPKTIKTEILTKVSKVGTNINTLKVEPITNIKKKIEDLIKNLWRKTIGNKEIYYLTDKIKLVTYTITDNIDNTIDKVSELINNENEDLLEKIVIDENERLFIYDSNNIIIEKPVYFDKFLIPEKYHSILFPIIEPNPYEPIIIDDVVVPDVPVTPDNPDDPTIPDENDGTIATIGDIKNLINTMVNPNISLVNNRITNNKNEAYHLMKIETRNLALLWSLIFKE